MYNREQWYRIAVRMASIMGIYEVFDARNTMSSYRCVYRIENGTKHTFFFSDSDKNWKLNWDMCERWMEANEYEYGIEYRIIPRSIPFCAYFANVKAHFKCGKTVSVTTTSMTRLIACCDAFLRIAGYDIEEVVNDSVVS